MTRMLSSRPVLMSVRRAHGSLAICCLALMALAGSADAQSVVVQAEGFASATNWTVVNSPDASGGQYATATVHTLNDRTLAPASYNVEVPSAGEYSLYVRAYVTAVDPNPARMAAGADQNDSVFIFDGFGGAPNLGVGAANERLNELFQDVSVGGIGVEQWGWVNASAGVAVETGIPGVLNSPQYKYTAAAAGPHVFNFSGREDGIHLDAFVFSLDPALSVAELDRLTQVPEPACLLLAIVGACGLAGATRRHRRG
ncbi:hypothetical protein Pla175_07320 [Pirellulimonas nuda]|uniref:PEP-CTERM protein-sorting domain-containing protein n=1 Tax=Pirellulimonas nuda TaxID=2528009 RepID=A0A518D7A9_9BACT|nr:hypothetical protein [Pirellulimonas nuda]QDU87373.1 hypothetical protein Pla175_07320 [Pirellulimonas nuda]